MSKHQLAKAEKRRMTMAFQLNHVHVKSPDPQQTAKFYVDNLGAEIMGDIPGRGVRLNLHGLTINLTTHVEDQKRQQHYGMEHFALNTDDIDTVVSNLTSSGAKLLEEMTSSTGRRVCFLEGPDGVQFELIQAAS
jgi:predicted enzyme related to lactoylglutathione lyase